MATVNPYAVNPNPARKDAEIYWWQTAESAGDGVANGDTVTMLEMPEAYAHVCVQALLNGGSFPASTTIALVGGVTNDASKAAALKDSGGTALTITAENGMVFLTGGIPPFVGFTVSGGSAGDIDVYLSRKPL